MKLKNLAGQAFLIFLAACILHSCSSSKEAPTTAEKYRLKQPLTFYNSYDEGYPLTKEKLDPESWYRDTLYTEYYTDYYKDKKPPPPFDFNVDLTKKSFNELRLLRSEIMARHGYLFMDYVLRSHFNATNWYKPVFWDENFRIKLSKEEEKFIQKVLKQEAALYKQNYTVVSGQKVANADNVVNWVQFEKIPQPMMQHLKRDGFVINKANYEQLFHVYDENYYDYTPSFITTDLYMQVLHMHISKEIQALEEEKLMDLLAGLVKDQYTISKNTAAQAKTPQVKKAAGWIQVYYAVALSLLTDQKQQVSADLAAYYQDELEKAQSAEGYRSDFLGDSLMDYTQFKPRGNYTRTDSLKKYFKCVKWLNSASIYLDEGERMRNAIFMGYAMMQSESAIKNYTSYSNVVAFLAGDENNLSLSHMLKVLKDYRNVPLDKLLSDETANKISGRLYAMDPKRMRPHGANDRTNEFIERKKLLFTAGRYTFDADIMQRLVHVLRYNLKSEPKRPFPKGLDVFAAMGNETAEDILLNVYKENEKWEDYSDSLDAVKKKFRGFNEWDKSVYNKTMETVLTLQSAGKRDPAFVQHSNWRKKDLNTMLAAWTGLKHDMILYIEQPGAAEMGDGGDVPPPQKIAYVEPRVELWESCIDLLRLNENMLKQNDMFIEKLSYRNKELIRLADFLKRMSQKELSGKNLTTQEFDSLTWVGGWVENLTIDILETGGALTASLSIPDRYIAIVADVYTYNGVDKKECLEEAVGMGDEIYVIAEINGLLYLTRGAVFSQYEFTQPTSERLTDEEWQKQLLEHKEPPGHIWMNDIRISVEKPKTAPNFNLY
jgi:hypothetical protein